MSKPVLTSPLPPRRRRSRRRRLALVALVLLACWGIYRVIHPPPPSVMLPDGMRITFHSVSRGKPGTLGFEHEACTNDSVMRRAWQSLRASSPSWMSRILPDWPLRTTFRGENLSAEFQLRFLTKDLRRFPKWRIGIADDDGWETAFNELGWYPVALMSPARPAEPDQIWLPAPLPRHSRLLRIRFHPTDRDETTQSDILKRKFVAEMVIPNPHYEGPAPPSSVRAPPVTKATRFGDITLTCLERRHLGGQELGGTLMEFQTRRGGKPVTKMSFDCENIADRSGQRFPLNERRTHGDEEGLYRVWGNGAPWSDDPVWKFRIQVHRNNYCEAVDESEIFHFDHLPVPQGTRTGVNRSITRNGVTFRIFDIVLVDNDWRVAIVCQRPGGIAFNQRVLIQDARDDQGRTHRTEDYDRMPIMYGPVGGNIQGVGYSIKLAPDARWWDLKLVLETIETIEFEARPTFIK